MKQMGLGAELTTLENMLRKGLILKILHLNSKLNDAKEETRQSTRNRKHYNAQCESLGNRKKTSVVRAQGGTIWDDVRIISRGSKLEDFVKKLNFILDAIKILRKVINLERDRIWLLLRRSLWLLWKMDWKKANTESGKPLQKPWGDDHSLGWGGGRGTGGKNKDLRCVIW